ncbi:MAG: carboxypeptidase-like regulatory domain-containing protein [Bacteroidota bacterium]
MKNVTTFFIAVLVFTVLCGCSNSTNYGCFDEYVYAVHVTLMDFERGQPIMGGKPTGTVREGNYTDSMIIAHRSDETGDYTMLWGAGERAGKYSVSVQVEGYEPWTKENIYVSRDDCHVIPQKITAFLKKK